MMKKLAAALLAAAITISISAPAFANDLVGSLADYLGLEHRKGADGTYYVSGDLDISSFFGTIAVTDEGLKLLTDDGLGTGNIHGDVAVPGKTYYISTAVIFDLVNDENTNAGVARVLKAIGSELTDKKLIKFSAKKEEGSKLVDSVKLVEKTFGKGYGHVPAIEIKMNDFYTDDEQKVELHLEFKLKDDYNFTKFLKQFVPGVDALVILEDGSTISADIEFWTNNYVETTDGEDVMAGDGGAIWKPTKNF